METLNVLEQRVIEAKQRLVELNTDVETAFNATVSFYVGVFILPDLGVIDHE